MDVGGIWFPVTRMPPGILLYHGTTATSAFDVPRGPAWFVHNHGTAFDWAGWSLPPPYPYGGIRRVIACVVIDVVTLVDTTNPTMWWKLCDIMGGDPDASTYEVAGAMVRAGLDGWYGGAEVMISRPHACLMGTGQTREEGDGHSQVSGRP